MLDKKGPSEQMTFGSWHLLFRTNISSTLCSQWDIIYNTMTTLFHLDLSWTIFLIGSLSYRHVKQHPSRQGSTTNAVPLCSKTSV